MIESVIHVFEILGREKKNVFEILSNLGHIFRVCSGCVQGVFRVCSECVQSVFKVCSKCVQSVLRVCSAKRQHLIGAVLIF